jgi:hypothetical protein
MRATKDQIDKVVTMVKREIESSVKNMNKNPWKYGSLRGTKIFIEVNGLGGIQVQIEYDKNENGYRGEL